MTFAVHRDEEAFFVKDVDEFGPLAHAIETQMEISIPVFVTVIVRHRCIKEAIMKELGQKKRAEEITFFCLAFFRQRCIKPFRG
jgi:hypothetical protein